MKHLKHILSKYYLLILAITLSGIFVALMEGLGLGLVIPLLEGVKNQKTIGIPFPLDRISGFFDGMDVVARLRLVALFLIIVTALKGIASYCNNILTCRLDTAVTKYFRMQCFDQLMKIGVGYLNKQKIAHIQTIMISYTVFLGALANMLGNSLSQVFTILVLMAMLLLLSWKMTVISFLIVSIASLLLRRIDIRATRAGKSFTETSKEINHAMLSVLSGMKVIRLFRREKDTARYFEEHVDKVNKDMLALVKARGAVKPLFEILAAVGLGAILMISSFLILANQGAEKLPIVLTFVLIFFRILTPALSFNQMRVSIRGDLPGYREVFRFLDTQGKPYITSGPKIIDGLRNDICFSNVDFGYNPKDVMVLKQIFFKVAKGSKVGIVGPSGSGKSTIIELFLRFYDPVKGDILVDGINLKTLDINSWRKCVGVVTQDTFLFNDTIRANIAFSSPGATQQVIEVAARQAHAHDFIQGLPDGYDTLVGERGVLLSGGQKQRIAIARAMLMNPDILIFDEATAALDTESEAMVQKALYEIGKEKTVIAIAHRLSTIYDSDMIMVIDNGKIVQQGTHQELMRQGGLYGKLVQMQNMESK